MTITLDPSRYATCWIIAYPTSSRSASYWPHHFSSESTRAQCIRRYLTEQRATWNPDRPEVSYTWRQWYTRGYRCVRVRMVLA